MLVSLARRFDEARRVRGPLALAAGLCVVFALAACSDDAGDGADERPPGTSPSSAVDAGGPDGSADGAVVPSCDDRNPCTVDTVRDGACTYEIVPDGTECDDGARCTEDDRCRSGVCSGKDVVPHVKRRGTFMGFGAPPNEEGAALTGLGEVISDDELVFAEPVDGRGLSLSLVRKSGRNLKRLDTRYVERRLERYNGGWDWSERPATFVIPLGGHRAVLAASRQGLDVFETSRDKLEPIASLKLLPTSEPLLAGAGRGSRFYTCSLHKLDAWEISQAKILLPRGSYLTPNDCRSLSLSADGTELLIASTRGIDRADLSDPRTITFKPTLAAERDFFRADGDADFIVGQRQGWYGELRDIEVYRRVDLEADPRFALPLAKFSATASTEIPSQLPIGFALLDRAIAIEWKRFNGVETTYETEIKTLPDGARRGNVFVHRRVRDDRLATSPFAISRRGDLMVVPPWRTVLHEDRDADALTALTSPEQSGFEGLSSRGPYELTALSGLAIHEIDLLDPDAPRVTSKPLPIDASFMRWEPNGATPLTTAPSVATGSIRMRLDPTFATCFMRGSSGELSASGNVVFPGQGFLKDLGSAMLHASAEDVPGAFRLRWYEAPSLCDGRVQGPIADGPIDFAPSDDRPRAGWAFDGDARGAPIAVIAEARGTPGGPAATTVAWLEREPSSGRWNVAARTELEGVPFVAALRVHGDDAVLHDGRRMYVVRRRGTQIGVVAARPIVDGGESEELVDILRFDGELVYVATRKLPVAVLVLRARDLERLARFDTQGLSRAMVDSGSTIAFGSAHALDIVDAVCQP